MCGIFGYIGNKNIIPLLVDGLKKLEYRGYDSAGICVSDGKKLTVLKRKGKIEELEKAARFNLASAFSGKTKMNFGIAHTRWATHGEPNETNSHPHLDCKGEIAVVHNGIIENYQTLKVLLQKEGHKFVSRTDSEVVAHLVEKFYDGDLEKAVAKTLPLLEGAYGLAIVHKNENKIIAARKGSPLVIGAGKGENFVSSDISAMLNRTRKIIYLGENELAVITDKNWTIKNINGKSMDKKIHSINWDLEEIEKGGFKHFMLKEIFQQPEAVNNTLRGRIRKNKIRLTLNIKPEKIKRIIITSCGTSWHSALIGKFVLERETGIPVEVDYASEFRYRDPIIKKGDLFITISQSGETADTLAALAEAKSKGAETLGIVNVVGSTIARESGLGIYLHAGSEIGVASTKAFSCQIVALFILALYIKQEKKMSLDKKILEELEIIPEKIKEVLSQADEIKKIARKLKDSKNFIYLGRGVNFPVALEGALKLKEISYIHAEGYPAAEMKHGPIALIDENMPVVFISPKDKTYEKILSNMEEIKARKGIIIAITNEEDDKISKLSDFIIKVPKSSDNISPIINTIPLQLLAYYIADYKGIDVDKPRNLAKSVTVE
ncbi:MAG: glutamine--fructose-6-phosphate transaminase (isomerizing) [Candidatus Pacebacteria bacterium]|nr:glutamine--fructose-6-phosphate transaminase (isomerizing) [Candidatus Paceibacterota bacterium]NUQ56966.1 glutamine--fructose-6-phosphate transaminase (isomerizing) [Candidatus Paceibacter sp.]